MYARRNILNNNSYTHVFFRCHNREFLFRSPEVKKFLLRLWAKYKDHYGIRIFEFAILDNHAHILLYTENIEYLGHFMRVVNSQLARFINKLEKRDSQAIKERYKSPLITNNFYLVKIQQYIWLNRYKANKQNPLTDPYCSSSWRVNPQVINYLFNEPKQLSLVKNLLESYENLPKPPTEPVARYVRNLINLALNELNQFTAKKFENSHTIGDEIDIKFRRELLAAFYREYIPIPPWNVWKNCKSETFNW